jgi:tetratricopeptide (TPR) repeat protein
MMPPHPQNSPSELGRLGLACLERYETDGDREALATGLARLEEAVAGAPGHPERMRWWYGLGSAYESRAEEHGSLDDYDRAVDWYAKLYAQLPSGDPDRTFVALTLTGASWSRFWLLRYRAGDEPEDCAALVEGVMAALRRWPVGEEDPAAAAFARMIEGLTHQERYDLAHDPVDLDRGILLLAGALPGLPDDTPWIAVAAFTLATAYHERYATGGDERMLDLAIEMGARAIELAGAEHPTWLSAHEHQALCFTERWRLAGDRGDLDRAIGAWQVVLAREDDSWSAALGGELMRERAELDIDATDAAEAVRLLDRAVRDCPDVATAAERWFELGRAHRAQWTVSRTGGGLEAADRCVSQVLSLGLADHEPVVGSALVELANLARLYHDRGASALATSGATGGDQAAGLADLRNAERISCSVLARTPTGDSCRIPVLLVCVLAGWARFSHTGDEEQLTQLDRLTAELVAAQPAGTDLHDFAVTTRGMVLARRRLAGPSYIEDGY